MLHIQIFKYLLVSQASEPSVLENLTSSKVISFEKYHQTLKIQIFL